MSFLAAMQAEGQQFDRQVIVKEAVDSSLWRGSLSWAVGWIGSQLWYISSPKHSIFLTTDKAQILKTDTILTNKIPSLDQNIKPALKIPKNLKIAQWTYLGSLKISNQSKGA